MKSSGNNEKCYFCSCFSFVQKKLPYAKIFDGIEIGEPREDLLLRFLTKSVSFNEGGTTRYSSLAPYGDSCPCASLIVHSLLD